MPPLLAIPDAAHAHEPWTRASPHEGPRGGDILVGEHRAEPSPAVAADGPHVGSLAEAFDHAAIAALKECHADFAESAFATATARLDFTLERLVSDLGTAASGIEGYNRVSEQAHKALNERHLALAESLSKWRVDKAALVHDRAQFEGRAGSLVNEINRHLDELGKQHPDWHLAEYALTLMSFEKGITKDLRYAQDHHPQVVAQTWRLEQIAGSVNSRVGAEAENQRNRLSWAYEPIKPFLATRNAPSEIAAAIKAVNNSVEKLNSAYAKISPNAKPEALAKSMESFADHLQRTITALEHLRKASGAPRDLIDRAQSSRARFEATAESLAAVMRRS
jgi:hypothetical protein